MVRGRLDIAAALSIAMVEIACSPSSPRQEVPTVALVSPSAAPSSSPRFTTGEPSTEPKPEPVRPLEWEMSEPDARAKARREGRPMIVYLRAEWAVASLRMERDVWSDARVVRGARPFVALKLDVTRAEGDAELYAKRYDAPGIPAIVVLDAHGEHVALLTGQTEIEALLEALRRASE